MEFDIVWSRFAESKLDEIFKYYAIKTSEEIAINLLIGIKTETDVLKLHQHIGQIEELLKDREFQYRYLVYKNYKIIYRVDVKERLIRIADIFDCRQHPVKMMNKESPRIHS